MRISRQSVARVSNPLPIPKVCPDCGAVVELKTHTEVYGMSYSDWPSLYQCSQCTARIGLHPFTDIPLGTLAGDELRQWRMIAKKPFEKWRKVNKIPRSEAYRRLADKLEISMDICHFGWFDVAMCKRAYLAMQDGI